MKPKDFVSKWKIQIEGIFQSEEKGRMIISFLSSDDFASDCFSVGFKMDCGEGFYKKYGENFFKPEVPYESAFSKVDDLHLLGSLIFSEWRYCQHWAHNPVEAFRADWFLSAFDRLEHLAKDNE